MSEHDDKLHEKLKAEIELGAEQASGYLEQLAAALQCGRMQLVTDQGQLLLRPGPRVHTRWKAKSKPASSTESITVELTWERRVTDLEIDVAPAPPDDADAHA